MSKKSWYKRRSQFTPYTKADGQAVSDEFDAIQASFERIPEMRDDGKGFAVSPIIPEPTEPNHPVTFGMLTESEKSVNNARDDAIVKAQQVAKNAQTVATNTQTAINQANYATQSATSAAASSRSADESEDMARKWASNPVNQAVSGDKYSALHYATKAEQSAQSLSTAAQTAKDSADIATQKAAEAKTYSDKVASAAKGEVDYSKVNNVPRASTTQDGITRLTSDTGLDSETLGLTAKAGKFLAQGIAALRLALNNYIPNSKKNSRVDSDSTDDVATPKAVKIAYDKAVSAEQAANTAKSNADGRIPKQVGRFSFNAQADGNFTVSENGVVKYDLADISNKAGKGGALPEISHLTDGDSKEKIASEYAVGQVSKSTVEKVGEVLNGLYKKLAEGQQADRAELFRIIRERLDSISERIGDDDNYAIKYIDGTMIQVALFRAENKSQMQYLTWRYSFVDLPMVFVTPCYYYYFNGSIKTDINNKDVFFSISDQYSTKSRMAFWVSLSNGKNHVYINTISIGRWK